MPLADRHVIANARLHVDFVQLTIGTFEHEHTPPRHQRLGFDFDVMQLQTQPLPSAHVNQL